MAKALEYPCVFKVLLNGGHICGVCNVSSGVNKYFVWSANSSVKQGYITEKQFYELVENRVIELISESSYQKDNAGNIYCYYRLAVRKKCVECYAFHKRLNEQMN